MMKLTKIAGIAMVLSAFVFAENTDSLKAEIERLTAQLQQAEQTKNIEPQTADIASVSEIETDTTQQELAVEAEQQTEETEIISTQTQKNADTVSNYEYSTNKRNVSVNITRDDTVLTILKVKSEKNDSITELDTTIKTIRIMPKLNTNNIYGIGGGVGIGGIYMDMKPIKDLYKEIGIKPSFDNREPMFLIGGFGMGGFINGMRVGGGGYSANAEFRTQKSGSDTVIVSDIEIGYGGFIIGRAWSKNKNSFYVQTLIGAGRQEVEIETQITNGSLWNENSDKNDNKSREANFDSKFFACDIQLGYTMSVMRWFHIGTEFSGLIMHSRNGFNSDNYSSFSPTAKVRFVFGSLR